jgi:transposase
MSWYVGLDWGQERHAVCVIDGQGKIVLEMEVLHTAEGLGQMLRRLAKIGPAEEMPVALERPSGLVVDALAEAGHPVVPIHPNAVKASRPRYRAAAGKSDPGDAYLLADLQRTDGHRFRVLRPASDEIRALRALVRTRDDLITQRVALTNQLRALLDGFWPGPVGLFADLDSPISLEFLLKYPTPTAARSLGPQRMAAFLSRQGYPGRRKPHQLLEHLASAPAGLAGPLEERAKGDLVRNLAALLQRLSEALRKVTSQVEHIVVELAAGQVLMSFPRVGKVNAAQILAELGDDPARFPSSDQLSAEAGVAPVTRSSGKHRAVVFRFACNNRLRRALTCFADNSRHESPWASSLYSNARARGCDHPHAVRILAKAWVGVLWRAWTDARPYDPARHRAAMKLAA